MKVAIIYLLAIVGAEMTVAFYDQLVLGIVFHIAILAVVILHSALASGYPDSHRHLILSLALAPLVRILSLSMPLVSIPEILWYPAIYVPLAVAAFIVMRVLGYRVGDVGLNFKWSPALLAVGLIGVGFGVAEYFILRPEPMVSALVWREVLPWALVYLLCTGFVEELIFRGVLQRTAGEVFGTWWGIVYVSVIFAFLHVGWHSWLDVCFVFVVALFFGWVAKKTGSLLGVTLSHGITNIVLFLIAPFFF